MMVLSKTFLDGEIKNSKITIEKLEQGLAINKLVLKAFEDELSKLK